MSGNCSCTCSATDPLVTRIALMRPLRTSSAMRSVTGTPDRAVGDDAAHPVTRLGEQPGEDGLGDLAAQGEDVARLGLEGDHLLRHAGRRVVALGHEIDAVADRLQRGGGGLADRGDLGRRGDRRAVCEQDVDRGGAGHREPVERAGLEVGERLVERRLVVRGREIDQRCDDRDRTLVTQVRRDAVAPWPATGHEHAPALRGAWATAVGRGSWG